MRRRIPAIRITAALLGAVALGVPANAPAAKPPAQYVSPWPVRAYDRTFTLQPGATQTFRLVLAATARPRSVLAPCWGFDLTGPGVDVAAAGLKGFGWIADPDADWRRIQPNLAAGAELRGDGWYLPESRAVVDLQQMRDGAGCRALGWSVFLPPDGAGVASRAEAARARRTRRLVRVRAPRVLVRAPRANTRNDGAVRVTLAGTRFRGHGRAVEVVVTTVAGALPGPTTITLHGRVLLQG
jgi:hypothetical protein